VDDDGAPALPAVDLLEAMRTALDGLGAELSDRAVDIEMSRVRVLADPVRFRQEFTDVVGSALSGTEPAAAITIRVERTGKSARIDVIDEDRAAVIGSLTLPIAPGTGSAADA
jgi:signal transduction histidine kinase